jgi:hypothetical protein
VACESLWDIAGRQWLEDALFKLNSLFIDISPKIASMMSITLSIYNETEYLYGQFTFSYLCKQSKQHSLPSAESGLG